MQRVALFLAVEPLQALTPAFLSQLAPELTSTAVPWRNTLATPVRGSGTPASAKGNAPDVSAAVGDAELKAALVRFDGNRAAVATHLGISRTTLWRRLKDLD